MIDKLRDSHAKNSLWNVHNLLQKVSLKCCSIFFKFNDFIVLSLPVWSPHIRNHLFSVSRSCHQHLVCRNTFFLRHFEYFTHMNSTGNTRMALFFKIPQKFHSYKMKSWVEKPNQQIEKVEIKNVCASWYWNWKKCLNKRRVQSQSWNTFCPKMLTLSSRIVFSPERFWKKVPSGLAYWGKLSHVSLPEMGPEVHKVPFRRKVIHLHYCCFIAINKKTKRISRS